MWRLGSVKYKSRLSRGPAHGSNLQHCCYFPQRLLLASVHKWQCSPLKHYKACFFFYLVDPSGHLGKVNEEMLFRRDSRKAKESHYIWHFMSDGIWIHNLNGHTNCRSVIAELMMLQLLNTAHFKLEHISISFSFNCIHYCITFQSWYADYHLGPSESDTAVPLHG